MTKIQHILGEIEQLEPQELEYLKEEYGIEDEETTKA